MKTRVICTKGRGLNHNQGWLERVKSSLQFSTMKTRIICPNGRGINHNQGWLKAG
jgi:hypothetical protein